MPPKETTPELETLIKGADTLSRLPLGNEAASVLGAPAGRIDILRTSKLQGSDFAAVLHGAGLYERELLGRGDDLPEVLRHASNLAFASNRAEAELSLGALRFVPPTVPYDLSEEQAAVAREYGDGEFAWLVEHARGNGVEAFDKEMARIKVRDGLFAFVMGELDPRADCDSREEALSRLSDMRGDIEIAQDAVASLDAAPAP